jgi:DNA-binding NtrC family response regulator
MNQPLISILVVDDKPDIRLSAAFLLSNHGYQVLEADSPAAALASLKAQPVDLMLLDMNFSHDTTSSEEGLYVLRQLSSLDSPPIVIAMTAWSNVDIAIKSLQQGAADFIEKPWDNSRLLQVIRQALKLANLQRDKQKFNQLTQAPEQELIAESAAMKSLLKDMRSIAETEANVLLTGMNGTGKSTIAKWIHQHSGVATNPFVSVNMGAIPENLFESELFGHTKGAFTDARETRIGRFELAESGTLFLDEIGNLPDNQQTKLLRVLESNEYEKVGSSYTQFANVRLISATNADLQQLQSQGQFRPDLFYRLNTFTVYVPSLRERTEDIIPLATYFLSLHGKKYQREELQLSPSAKSALQNYDFPGNIRELSHLMERAALLASDAVIHCDQLSLPVLRAQSPMAGSADPALEEKFALPMMTLEQAERQLIKQALTNTQGQVMEAAALLGLSKSAIYRRMEKYGIDSKEFVT